MPNIHTPKSRGCASASLGAAIADLTDGYGRFNAPGADPDKDGDALIAQTYGPPLEALENWNAPATSVHEAAAALWLVDNELRVNAAPSLCPPMVSAALGFIDPFQVSPELQCLLAEKKVADDERDSLEEKSLELREEFFAHLDRSLSAELVFNKRFDVVSLRDQSDAAVERSSELLQGAMDVQCVSLGDVAAKLDLAKGWLGKGEDHDELYWKENSALLASMLPLFIDGQPATSVAPAAVLGPDHDRLSRFGEPHPSGARADIDIDAIYRSVREGLGLVRLVKSGLESLSGQALGCEICDAIGDMEQACVVAVRSLTRSLEALDDLDGL